MAIEPNYGMLNVVPPAELEQRIAERDRQQYLERQAAGQSERLVEDNLASHIRTKWAEMRRHRNSKSGWSGRLIAALRTFNGEYPPEVLAEIRRFGGSEVYARTIAMKCRGASSLLRDIYLAPDRSWGIEAPADPDVPEDISMRIQMLVESEVQTLVASGMDVTPTMIRDRITQLMEAARGGEKGGQTARQAGAGAD